MKWAHLPNNGGIYEQNPGLIDRFYYIFSERGKVEVEKEQKRQRERDATTRGGAIRHPSRGGSGRRR